jgi:hypothetical protein
MLTVCDRRTTSAGRHASCNEGRLVAPPAIVMPASASCLGLTGAKPGPYTSVPEGESKCDNKGRLRADGFKLVIVPDEARIIQRIFRAFNDCKAIIKIAKELNDECVPTKARLKKRLGLVYGGSYPQGRKVHRSICLESDDKHEGSTYWQD